MAIFKRNTARAERPRVSLRQRSKAFVASAAKILHFPLKRAPRAESADAGRRALMVGSLAAAASAPLPAFGGGDGGDGVVAAYLEWRAVITESRELTRAYDAACKSLPWWAGYGPEHLNHKGEHVGIRTGWPAIQDLEPPTRPDAVHHLRPDPYQFEHASRLWGRERAIGHYRSELRAYALRKRAQNAEKERAGIPAIEAALEVNDGA